MKISLAEQAQLELVESAVYYARHANAEIAEAFLAEFDRSASLLAESPKLGTTWRGRVRRLPLRRFPYSIVYYLSEAEAVFSPSRIRGVGRAFGKGAHECPAHAV